MLLLHQSSVLVSGGSQVCVDGGTGLLGGLTTFLKKLLDFFAKLLVLRLLVLQFVLEDLLFLGL